MHGALVRLEADREPLDLEQGLLASARRLRVEHVAEAVAEQVERERGKDDCESRVDREPRRLGQVRLGAFSITPHDDVGGRTPSPRNESTASPMIAAGIRIVA